MVAGTSNCSVDTRVSYLHWKSSASPIWILQKYPVRCACEEDLLARGTAILDRTRPLPDPSLATTSSWKEIPGKSDLVEARFDFGWPPGTSQRPCISPYGEIPSFRLNETFFFERKGASFQPRLVYPQCLGELQERNLWLFE